jgi:hypothetical protein
MSEVLRARLALGLYCRELLEDVPAGTGQVALHDQFNRRWQRDSASLVAPDRFAAELVTIGAPGYIDLDLTDLQSSSGAFDATDLGLIALRVFQDSGPSGPLEIDGGIANGYDYLNDGEPLELEGGLQWVAAEPLDIVHSTHRLLRLTAAEGSVWAIGLLFADPTPSGVLALPTADTHLRAYHGTHKPYSETFGVLEANWAGQMAYTVFTIWLEPGDDALVRDPQDSAELVSGDSTGSGTYTLAEMLEHAFDRLLEAHPDQRVGLYIAGGYLFTPEYLFEGYQFISVYPRGHVRWSDAYGRAGGALGYAVESTAISSMADSGGFLAITFAGGQTIPTGSLIDIAGTSLPAYNVTGALVTSGAAIVDGGGTTATTIVTDVPWVSAATGGTVVGGARKTIDWADEAVFELFHTDAWEILDANLAAHPRVDVIWMDEISHPQIDSAFVWATRCAGLATFKASAHARGCRFLINLTWHIYSASALVRSDNSGAGSRLRILMASNATFKVGDTVTVSGHATGTANVTATVFAKTGRYLTLDTTAAGAGADSLTGMVTNDSIDTEDLDQLIAAVDGFTLEGAWRNDIRYEAATVSYLANRRRLLDAGLWLCDIAQARQSTCTISTSVDDGGKVRHNVASGTCPTHGARIGLYGLSVSGYNEITTVRRVADDNSWFTTEQTYSSDATGGSMVYSDTGRIVAVDSIDNTGAGSVVRLHCDTDHHIFPQEGSPSITLYGPSSWADLLDTPQFGVYVPLAVSGQPAKIDLTSQTETVSTSDRGYLVDTTGCKRFAAALAMYEREVGDRIAVDQDLSITLPGYDSWPVRAGVPGARTPSFAGGGAFDLCDKLERVFENGLLEIWPQENYAVFTIDSVPE